MNAITWLIIGAMTGLVHVYTIARTVSRLRPEARLYALLATVGGALMRYGIAALTLSVALQQDALSGVLAFVGMLVSRWFAVYLLNSDRLTWIRPRQV